MTSRQETVDYIIDQMSAAGDMRSRKMFGEYAVYCNDKVVALVCDNKLFIKITEPVRNLLAKPVEGRPYPGAKPHFEISPEYWDDVAFMSKIAKATADVLSLPAKKKRKGSAQRKR
ncbi:MAG TPA: TfoX/Sxy family protein [Nitrososphaera sp.]